MNEVTTKGEPLPAKAAALLPFACEALAANYQEASTVIADAQRKLKRTIARAEALSYEWTREEVKPIRGPTIEFWGKEVGHASFSTVRSDPMRVDFEVWETRAGALVAIVTTEPTDRDGFQSVRALVVEPQHDVQAMRLAVMDFFDWHDCVRNMARKAGWDLRLEVE